MRSIIIALVAIVLVPAGTGSLSSAEADWPGNVAVAAAMRGEPVQPVPPAPRHLDTRLVQLGRMLFHDRRMSRDDSISCAHCHPLATGGMDGLPHSMGIEGREGAVNAPTVYNSSLNFVQFWNGRARSLEEQVDGPVHNPVEMDTSWPQVADKLRADPQMAAAFTALWGDPEPAPERIRAAIAAFERTLTTQAGRFDRHLQGEQQVLTDREREGYALFKSYGCSSCHQGQGVGGNLYEKMGVFEAYFPVNGEVSSADLGRFTVTGNPAHKHEFKVPSLRNVTLTAPYFHNGAVATLGDAIGLMARHQLGRTLPEHHKDLLQQFLGTLSGLHPELRLAAPDKQH
ncbi:MAG: cytochrome B6 [Magnetococcus sp. WYHC-3]